MRLRVEIERESADRWIADVVTLPGVMVYGRTKAEAIQKAKILALEVIADRLKHGEDLRTGRAVRRTGSARGSSFQGLEFATA